MTKHNNLRSALEPCPFCSAEMQHYRDEQGEFFMHPGLVTDSDCFMSGKGVQPRHYAAWNRRALASDTIGNGGGETMYGMVVDQAWLDRHPPVGEPVGLREPPKLLSEEEGKSLLEKAECLWKDLQANNLGGFSGPNRPFYILHEFRRVIEEYGGRDVGLKWSKNQLDALATPARTDETAPLQKRIAELEAEVARLRVAIKEIADGIENGENCWVNLYTQMCCSGRDCGCQGSIHADLITHDLRAALTPEKPND